MADLQEALAARERRSRFTAIAISAVIILLVGFIVFRIANNNEQDVATEDQAVTEQTEQTTGQDTAETGVDLDELFGVDSSEDETTTNDATTEPEAAESQSSTTSSQVASSTTTTEPDSGDLPSTGPAENAALATIALIATYTLYTQNKSKLAQARLK